ncbi:MAG: phage head closure protein [Rhizobium rhizophilum]|uniref:phage head closure protein n=1 Tax=Rhizobium rhizophilum TaxID=1850373 RepID=UPI00391D66DE
MVLLDIDAGRLTARLVLERPDMVEDVQGGAVTGFVEVARVWALIEPRSFGPEEKGPGLVSTVTHHVTVRARGDLTAGQRFRKGTRFFEIEAVRDPDESGRFRLALCREVAG